MGRSGLESLLLGSVAELARILVRYFGTCTDKDSNDANLRPHSVVIEQEPTTTVCIGSGRHRDEAGGLELWWGRLLLPTFAARRAASVC